MSKELEALKRIKSHYNDRVCIDILEDFDLIETALKRLEEIETTTPSVLREDISKKLKALEIIREYFALTSEYGKISFELKKTIPEDKYDLLKEVLL